MSVCLSVSVSLSVCLSVCVCLSVSDCLYVFLSVCLCLSVCVCLSVCLSVSVSDCLYVCLSVCLCLFVCLCLSVCMCACMCVRRRSWSRTYVTWLGDKASWGHTLSSHVVKYYATSHMKTFSPHYYQHLTGRCYVTLKQPSYVSTSISRSCSRLECN